MAKSILPDISTPINITVTLYWAWRHLQSPASQLFTQPFIQAQIKENIKEYFAWYLYRHKHYSDIIMSMMASPIPSLTIVYSTVYSGRDQRKHQSSASLAFVRGIHRWPVNSPHKGPVMWKMFPFDDVIMELLQLYVPQGSASLSLGFLHFPHLCQLALRGHTPAVWTNNPIVEAAKMVGRLLALMKQFPSFVIFSIFSELPRKKMVQCYTYCKTSNIRHISRQYHWW